MMRKIISIALISLFFVITPFVVISKFNVKPLNIQVAIENLNNNKDIKWEYIKDRLFDGKSINVYKVSGPILILLEGANKEDSIAVKTTILQLKKILPNKIIDYFENYTKVNFNNEKEKNKKINGTPIYEFYNSVIVFNFKKPHQYKKDFLISSTLSDQSIIKREQKNLKNFDSKSIRFSPENIYFSFSKKISLEKKSEYIQYEFFRWLCYINPEKNYSITYKNQMGIFNAPEYLPEKGKLNQLDKFLLKKLYSDTFIDEFKVYLYSNYPWRYANMFLNKKKTIMYTYTVLFILAILLILASFAVFQNFKFKHPFFSYFFPILILNMSLVYFANIYTFLVELNTTVTWDNNFKMGFLFSIGLTFIMSFFLWSIEKLCIKKRHKFKYKITLHFLFTLLTLSVLPSVIISKKGIENTLEATVPLTLTLILLSCLRSAYIYFNHYSENIIKQKDVELSKLKELQATTELNSLHAQINPHFLYNSLNSLASLAHINPDKTEKMALFLSDLFKYSTNRKGEKMSTIQDEVEMVTNYLQIEKIRFEDRLQFSIEVHDDLLQTQIPRFLLQPLIENAIKHGISKIEEQGVVQLLITKNNNNLYISVSDNGPNFPDGLISGHGLQSVYDLLRLSYGEQATINWENLPKKKITVIIRSNS
ncbi:MAG: histidine kinase [Flavobacteriaceae bacterium]|nr:histidine kinase [Flavobacteriaceae bacterium]